MRISSMWAISGLMHRSKNASLTIWIYSNEHNFNLHGAKRESHVDE